MWCSRRMFLALMLSGAFFFAFFAAYNATVSAEAYPPYCNCDMYCEEIGCPGDNPPPCWNARGHYWPAPLNRCQWAPEYGCTYCLDE